MTPADASIQERRPLTMEERDLARWMLEHGNPEAVAFLDQLSKASVVARCPCGCASIDIEIEGQPSPGGGLHVLGDYVFGTPETLAGAFIFECGGVLAGLEVYGLAGDAPGTLPRIEELRSWASTAQ